MATIFLTHVSDALVQKTAGFADIDGFAGAATNRINNIVHAAITCIVRGIDSIFRRIVTQSHTVSCKYFIFFTTWNHISEDFNIASLRHITNYAKQPMWGGQAKRHLTASRNFLKVCRNYQAPWFFFLLCWLRNIQIGIKLHLQFGCRMWSDINI